MIILSLYFIFVFILNELKSEIIKVDKWQIYDKIYHFLLNVDKIHKSA